MCTYVYIYIYVYLQIEMFMIIYICLCVCVCECTIEGERETSKNSSQALRRSSPMNPTSLMHFMRCCGRWWKTLWCIEHDWTMIRFIPFKSNHFSLSIMATELLASDDANVSYVVGGFQLSGIFISAIVSALLPPDGRWPFWPSCNKATGLKYNMERNTEQNEIRWTCCCW